MIEIVFLVCAIHMPTECKDVRLNFIADRVSQRQCMLYGQHEIAKWTLGHPKWRVARWRCGVAGQMAEL